MIRLQILGFSSGGDDGRFGDCQIVTDENYCVVVDGYCGTAADMVISTLKERGLKDVYLYLSHPHYDHLDGLIKIMNDSYFNVKLFACYAPSSLNGGSGNSEIRDDINYLNGAISLAKSKGIPVKYLSHGDRVKHGDIEFEVYRKQPAYKGNSSDPHGWSYLNDGSLCFWFPSLRYWTSGDGPEEIYTLCKEVGANPVCFKVPHHGNNCPRSQAQGMKSLGALYCWDNSYQTEITEFLQYGRGRCIEAGLKYFGVHGDINIVACTGNVHIYKDWEVYSYPCSYRGKNTLKGADDVIVSCVVNDKAGNGNERISYLLNRGYNPFSVQNAVNKALKKPKWVHNWKGWWYKFADGSFAKGWQKLAWSKGVSWFLFGENGYMLTGWQKASWSKGTNWFYFDETNGDMQTGWLKYKGYWYFLDLVEGYMHTGWVSWKGKKCYLDENGKALCNCVKTIDGKTYRFDENCYAEEITGDVTSVTGKLNDISATRRQFVIDIATYVRMYAPQYGICVYSPIIAQAIHESGWGESKLSAKYHNYFGLKCGTKWTGKSVNLKTQEEYSAGSLTTISANFRAYDSMEEGVKGYFEFIQLPRYANLKGVTSPRQYLENIKNDGYATGSSYVEHNMTLINEYSLTQFDMIPTTTNRREKIVNLALSMVGIKEGSAKHHGIIDTYNSYGASHGYPRGYKMTYTAAWCATFVAVLGILSEMTDIIPVECGCPQMVALAKSLGEWVENDSYSPKIGDIVLYDWQDSGSGDNTGNPDHIGIVTKVDGNSFEVTEGNYKDAVTIRHMTVNGRYIRGFICPKY